MESQTLKKIIYFLLALTPLTLWFVSDGKILGFINQIGENGLFFPFISGKNLLFRFLVEVAFICWVLLVAQDRKYGLHRTPVAVAVYVFTGVILLADLLGVNVRSSLFSGFERMEGFVGLIHYALYFIVLTSILKTKEEWENFSKWIFASSFLVSLYAFFQLLGHPDFVSKIPGGVKFAELFPIHQGLRLDSTLGNPSYYAIFCVYIIGLSVYALFSKWKNPTVVVLSSFSILVHTFLLMYTGTRGAVLGLVAGVFVASALYVFEKKRFMVEWSVLLASFLALVFSVFFVHSLSLLVFFVLLAVFVLMSFKALFVFKEKSKKIVATGLILVAGIVFALSAGRNSNFVQNTTVLKRATTLSLSDGTVNSRLMVWKTSFEGFKDRPFLGWGQDNFPYVFAKHHNPDMYVLEPWYDRSHNVFFDWLIAGGISGLLAHLALYVTAVYMTHKAESLKHSEKSLIYGVFVAQFVHNLFIFDNLASYMFFYALLAYISVMYVLGREGHPKKHEQVKDVVHIPASYLAWGAPLTIVVTIILSFQSVIFPYFANAAAIRGMASYSGDPLTVMRTKREGFESAVQLGSVGQREIREQFVEMSYQILGFDHSSLDAKTQSLIGEEQQLWYKDVLELADADLKRYPDDLRVLELYGIFYMQTQDMAKAEEILKKAHELAPMRQRTTLNLAQLHLLKGDIPGALELIKGIYNLTPKYDVARKAYVAIAFRYGVTDNFKAFKEAVDTVHKNGDKVVYPTSFKTELVGINDVKVADVYLNVLKADYPASTTEIDAFRKTLISQK